MDFHFGDRHVDDANGNVTNHGDRMMKRTYFLQDFILNVEQREERDPPIGMLSIDVAS